MNWIDTWYWDKLNWFPTDNYKRITEDSVSLFCAWIKHATSWIVWLYWETQDVFVSLNGQLFKIFIFWNISSNLLVLLNNTTKKVISDEEFCSAENFDYSVLKQFTDKLWIRRTTDLRKIIKWESLLNVKINWTKCILATDSKNKFLKIKESNEFIVDYKEISIITASWEEYIYVEREDWIWLWVAVFDIDII